MHDKIGKVEAIRIGSLEGALKGFCDNLLLLFSKINELRLNLPDNHHRYMNLAIELERLSKEIEAIQKAGDDIMVRMPPTQRKQCKKQVPIFLGMFGWHDRIDDNGNIIYNA